MILFLLKTFVLRRLVSDWQRVFLLVSGIALAVSVFLAVMYASSASIQAFKDSLSPFKDSYEIKSRKGLIGLDEIEPILKVLPSSVYVSPLSYNSADWNGQQIKIIGADLLALGLKVSDTLVSPNLMTELGSASALEVTQAGKSFILENLNFDLPKGIYLSGKSVLIDIALLEDRIGEAVKINSIRLASTKEDDQERLKEVVNRLPLAPFFYYEGDTERSSQAQRLLGSFRMNIMVMVVLTMVVSLFAVYNSAQLSIRSLVPELATMHTLGLTRMQVQAVLVMEHTVLGALGSIIGLTLGTPLTLLAAKVFSTAATSLYFHSASLIDITPFSYPELYALSFALGVLVCLLGVLIPSKRMNELQAGLTHSGLRESKPANPFFWVIGALLLGVGGWIAQSKALELRSPMLAHSASIGVLGCLIFLSMIFLKGTVHFLKKPLLKIFGEAGLIASSQIFSGLRYASFAVASTAVGISLLLGLGILVFSFRETLRAWVDYSIRADVFVRAENPLAGNGIGIKEFEIISRWPEVLSVVRLSTIKLPVCLSGGECNVNKTVRVQGLDFLHGERFRYFKILEGPTDFMPQANDNRVLVSEGLARRLKLKPGDIISIGPISRTVGAVYSEYSSEQGLVLMPFESMKSEFGEIPIESLSIYLKDSAHNSNIHTRLDKQFADRGWLISDNAELKTSIFKIFDQTFAITIVIRAVAALICGFGFALMVTQLMWERKRELRTLLVLGLSFRKLKLSLFLEEILLLIPALILGVTGGLLLSSIMINVINPVSFGWSLETHYRGKDFLLPVAVMLASSILPLFFMLPKLGKVFNTATLSDE